MRAGVVVVVCSSSREKMFCIASFVDTEKWEEKEEHEAKRQRYVSSAMYEQSMATGQSIARNGSSQ